MDRQTQPSQAFAQLYAGCQSRLYAFIYSLLGNADHADDVLQNTNLVMWQKAGEFEEGTNFTAWAFRIAYLQVLAHREKLGRDHVIFSDELLHTLSREVSEYHEEDGRHVALADCLSRLPDRQRELLRRRYSAGESLQSLAKTINRSAGSLAVTLHRLRLALMRCIEAKMQGVHE